MQRVAVFGIGYVGCVTAGCLSQDGHHVVGVDVDPAKVAEVNAGSSPVSEPGLDEIIKAQVASGRLRATINVDEAVANTEIALIAVGTPSADDGSVNADGIERVIRSIGRAIKTNEKAYRVVIRSTLLPGILEDELRPVLEQEVGQKIGPDLVLCNNPEFLRESSAVEDYYNPPYILIGADSEADAAPVVDLYHAVQTQKIVTDTRSAALVKYACNAYHAIKVAFANEIGSLARAFGADGHGVMELVCKDRKLNVSAAYLRPGFAFGGSCLPKDLRALTRFAEQQALQRADGVVAVSRDLARKVIELGADPSRVHLIYNGVDPEVFYPGDRIAARQQLGLDLVRPFLLYVGNLFPVKGPDILIEAYAQLIGRGVDCDLHVVGAGSLRPALERQAAARGVAGKVRFHGVIPHERLPDWFRAADMLVLPSWSEGVPNVLLEASACGIPYVATHVGGVPEIAHLGAGRLVPPGDPVRLAEAIEAVLSLPPAPSAGGAVGRTHAEVARELTAVFEAAIGEDSARAVDTLYKGGELADAPASSAATMTPNGEEHPPDSPTNYVSSGPGMIVRPASWVRQVARRGLAVVLPRRVYITHGPRRSGAVCLTFDDGPHPEVTPRLLDLLASLQVHATFFLVGEKAEKCPGVIRRMVAEGHSVGTHTYSHPMHTALLPRDMAREVRRGVETIADILGERPNLYRPPHGKVSAGDLWRLWRAGLTTVLWNIDPKDYKQSADALWKAFQAQTIRGGDLILLHDIYHHTIECLPEVIAAIRRRGLEFTTVETWTK